MSDEPITDMDDVEAACWARVYAAYAGAVDVDGNHRYKGASDCAERADWMLKRLRQRRPAPVATEPTAARERAAIFLHLQRAADRMLASYGSSSLSPWEHAEAVAAHLHIEAGRIKRGEHHK